MTCCQHCCRNSQHADKEKHTPKRAAEFALLIGCMVPFYALHSHCAVLNSPTRPTLRRGSTTGASSFVRQARHAGLSPRNPSHGLGFLALGGSRAINSRGGGGASGSGSGSKTAVVMGLEVTSKLAAPLHLCGGPVHATRCRAAGT